MFSFIEKESFTYRDYVYPWYGEILGKIKLYFKGILCFIRYKKMHI